MSITIPALTAALAAIGNAHVYVGDAITAQGGMSALGKKNGPATVSVEETYSDLTAEQTGPTVHARKLMGVQISVTVPLIVDGTVWAKISPTGTKGGGWSTPQTPTPTTVWIAPDDEVGGGLAYPSAGPWARTAGNGVGAASGAGAAPVNSFWIWRAVPSMGDVAYSYDDGGRMVVPVTFTSMFDASKPEGHKVYTIGDPRAVTPTPIPVLI
jgi:hypothetical protein